MILHLLLVRLAYILIILFRLGLCNTVDALDDSADFGKHLPSRAVDGIAKRQNGGFGIKAVNVRKGVLRHGAVAQTAAHCRHIDGTLRDEVGKNRRLLLRLCPFQRAADHGILQIGVQLFAVLRHKQGCLQAENLRQALGVVLFLQGLQGRIAVGIGDLPAQWFGGFAGRVGVLDVKQIPHIARHITGAKGRYAVRTAVDPAPGSTVPSVDVRQHGGTGALAVNQRLIRESVMRCIRG